MPCTVQWAALQLERATTAAPAPAQASAAMRHRGITAVLFLNGERPAHTHSASFSLSVAAQTLRHLVIAPHGRLDEGLRRRAGLGHEQARWGDPLPHWGGVGRPDGQDRDRGESPYPSLLHSDRSLVEDAHVACPVAHFPDTAGCYPAVTVAV